MNSMISCSRLLAAALCGVVLAGCNAVEDVREAPFTPVPTQGVVLQGKVQGTLGKQRSLTLMNNGNSNGAISVSATIGTVFTPFTFGIVPAGSAYNITVKANPYGKICTVAGGTGTVTTPEALNIVVTCVNDPTVPRYALRVTVPPAFVSSQGATVTLTTEEGVFTKTPATGTTFVQFDSALFHNVKGGVTFAPVFTWTVTATNTEGSTPGKPLVNKCVITNGTNPSGASPTADIGMVPGATTNPTVGSPGGAPVGNPCQFTIGGTAGGTSSVYYSTPPGGTPQAMPTGGLDLQLRDVLGNVVETLPFTAGYGASGNPLTPGTNGSGYTFVTPGRSNPTAVYDVVVSRQPTGQTCIVANGGAATLGVATANITNVGVACRANPAAANRLRGTYEFRSGIAWARNNAISNTTFLTIGVADTTTTYISKSNPDLGGASRGQSIVTNTTLTGANTFTSVTTTNNTITRNLLTFFEDGTFLHGVHGGNQVEHGFYSYNPTTRVIVFTLITDTTTGGTTSLLTTGLSGVGGAATVNGSVQATMTNVVKGTSGVNGTLSGDFAAAAGPAVGTYPAGAINTTTPNPPLASRWSQWFMVEPNTTTGQVEGTWVSKDHRRAWVYDNNTTLGYHTGVNGGAPNMQDACYTFEDFRDSVGFFTRRGGLTGCLGAVDTPVAGIGTVDFQSPALTSTPGFVGRFPGSGTAFDGRSPSPIYYAVGTPANLATVVAGADLTAYFPTTDTTPAALSWCTTEVLAVRYSLNALPIDFPVYLCRERHN